MAREELAAVTLPRRITRRLLPETSRAFHSPLPSVFPWASADGWGQPIRNSAWSRAKFKPGASGLGNLRAQPRRPHQDPLPEREHAKCSLLRWDNSFPSFSAKEKQLFISSRKLFVSFCIPMQQIFFSPIIYSNPSFSILCVQLRWLDAIIFAVQLKSAHLQLPLPCMSSCHHFFSLPKLEFFRRNV